MYNNPMMEYHLSKLKIVAAAIKKDGVIWTLPRPARHHNIIFAMNDVGKSKARENKTSFLIEAHGKQGFIDGEGNFLNREDAAKRAILCGQLTKPLIAPPNLFSEDLW